MIRTSNYKNFKYSPFKTISISGDRGKSENYVGEYYYELAPRLSFWKIWHDNIGLVKEEANNRFYIEEYYKQVLSELDPERVYKDLADSILLCYEDNDQFCHRHIVAAWFELILNKQIEEVALVNGEIVRVDRPEYIKDMLETAIKNNKDMKGFNSLYALYLSESAQKLESKAQELEKNGKPAKRYKKAARYLKGASFDVENKYMQARTPFITKNDKEKI